MLLFVKAIYKLHTERIVSRVLWPKQLSRRLKFSLIRYKQWLDITLLADPGFHSLYKTDMRTAICLTCIDSQLMGHLGSFINGTIDFYKICESQVIV